jgi:hypothetical protein
MDEHPYEWTSFIMWKWCMWHIHHVVIITSCSSCSYYVRCSSCCYCLVFIMLFSFLWLVLPLVMHCFTIWSFIGGKRNCWVLATLTTFTHKTCFSPKIVSLFIWFFIFYWKWCVDNVIKFDYAKIIYKLKTLITPWKKPWNFFFSFWSIFSLNEHLALFVHDVIIMKIELHCIICK